MGLPEVEEKKEYSHFNSQKLRHASEFLGPPADPEWYPGQRPRSHYVITPNQRILPVHHDHSIDKLKDATVNWNGNRVKLNNLLKQWGEDPLEARIPVAAYGANRGPVRLIAKLRNADKPIIVPTIRGVARSAVVLFNSYIWRNGHFASQINPALGVSSRLRKTPVVECWINLLSLDQIKALHGAQKIDAQKNGYYLTKIPWTYNKDTIEVYAYASTLPCMMINGKYARFASNRHKGKDRNGNVLLPGRDFAPINSRNTHDLDMTVEKCQVEVMDHAAQLIKMEFGIKLYKVTGGNHAYRISDEASERKNEINEFMKKIGKKPHRKYHKIRNPYNIDTLGDLL